MSEKASLKEVVKPKYRRKTVIRDQDLDLVLVIPVTPSKSGEDKLEPRTYISRGAEPSGKGKVLELYLLEPIIHRATDITSSVSKDIIESSKFIPLNYITRVQYIIKPYTKITLLNVEKKMCPEYETMSNIIENTLKNIPSIEIEKYEAIKRFSIDKLINTKVKISLNVFNYIEKPRLIFYQPYKIKAKHGKINVEVGVKTLELLSSKSSSENPVYEKPVEDILEYFFSASLSGIVMNRPYLILAEKPEDEKYSYIELLKRLLRELYRIYIGGLPRPFDLETSFEEVKLEVEAGGRINVIDMDAVFPKGIGRNAIKYIVDRLRELYSQSLGFLVFYGSKKRLDEIRDLVEYRVLPSGVIYNRIIKPFNISIREEQGIFCLTNILWGKVKEFEHVEETVDLNAYAVTLEEEFYDKIFRLARDPDVIVKVEPSKRDEEGFSGESLLHYGVKAFVVKYLLEHEKVLETNISTEHSLGNIFIDVYVKHPEHGDLAIEVETLYGTVLPLLKLRKTIETRLSKGLKLWIVIPNPQFILFLKDLGKLREIYRRKYLDQIEFFTLDIYEQSLIPYPGIIERINQIVKSSKTKHT